MCPQKHKQKQLSTKTELSPQGMRALLGIFLIISYILAPLSAYAWTFDPNNIITDAELRDKDSLSQSAIGVFLNREGSALRNYAQNVNGTNKTASEIIWEVSQAYNISPKFLLTTLEKEKGLIQKSTATDKDLDWAMGYSCFSSKCNDKYKGFLNQVESAAITQNIYYEKASSFQFQPNISATTKDGYAITPRNQATANLYIYTPYIGYAPDYGYTNIEKTVGRFGANHLFWQIWTRYFSEKKIPNGFVIKNNDSFWLIELGKKRKFSSKDIYIKDYKESEAVNVSQKVLDAYENGPEIYFANNTLVKSSANNQAFLITNKVKRPIVDNAALALLSDFRLAITSIDEVPYADNVKLDAYALGNPIDINSKFPQGKLVKNELGQIYFIQDGLRYLVDNSLWSLNYGSKITEDMHSTQLEAYILGSQLKIKDGSIVKNTQGVIYLISDGEKIKIKNPEIAPKIFNPDIVGAAIVVSDNILNLHEDSLNISYIDDTIQDPIAPPPETLSSFNYDARLESMNPEGLILYAGQKKTIEMKIKNTGGSVWKNKEVWLEIDGKDSPINSKEESVAPEGIATFTFDLEGSKTLGLSQIQLTLYRNENGQKKNIITFGKFVLIKSGDTAEIVSHNIPIAVKSTWKTIQIKMKVKNTSESLVWLSRKTALEIYDASGGASPFYDPNDWVRKEVAAVPFNKSSIKPGETGEFQFTLKIKGDKPGTYALKFKLNLLDKNKKSALNGSDEWIRFIRIDK